MAYFALLWKARTIEKYRLNYEREKLNSIRLTQTQNPKKTLYQRWCQCNFNTKKRLSQAFLHYYPEGSPVYNFFLYLRTDLTFPNFVLKSVIGFVGGIILTYLCFMFFVFQLSISLMHATFMSSIIGVLLTLGLAFSFRIRCLVFLLIPQFFSRVGRYTLTCYALVLILTGPATNTLKNSEVLSESLACAQEQIKTNMHQVNDSMRRPFNCMKDSIRIMIESINQLAVKLKQICIRVHRLVLSSAHTLQSSFSWLSSTANSCNKKLGTPYDHCNKALDNAMIECKASVGPKYSWICDVNHVTKLVCAPIRHLKSFCRGLEFNVNGNILGTINKKLKTFYERLNSMLYLEVNVHHSYSFNSNSSRSASQVAAGIVTEIRNRADPLLTWLSWSSCVTSLSLLLIIFRAKYYQFMFETRPRFDNRYITKELRDLDLKRLRQRKETILPLNRREEVKYIKTTSFRLLSSEKIHISRSAVSMAYTTFKLMIHMVADYSLYWVLMTIRYHGRFQTPMRPGLRNTGMYVSGTGFLSKIFQSVLGSINLPLTAQTPSPITCLPAPYPPDFQRYSQIGVLVFLLWFSALLEPYGLRLRHVIMGLYRPERAKARAVWLFNRIQKTRGGFMKFARRKLHREYKYSTESKHTFRLWLYNNIPFSWLRCLLGIKAEKPHCFLCGIIENCNEVDCVLITCKTPRCPGTYCNKCFSDIGELCTICLSPADYGDMSDVSLELGSSDEDDDDDEQGSFEDNSNCAAGLLRSPKFHNLERADLQSNRSKWSLFTKKSKTRRDDPEGTSISYKSNNMRIFETTDSKSCKNGEIMMYNVSKAMLIRHRKYSESDLRDSRRNKIECLDQDGIFCICLTKHDILRRVCYCAMVSEARCASHSRLSFNKFRKKDNKNKNLDNSFDSPNAGSSVTTENSITKMLRRFRALRKYSLMSRGTQKIKRSHIAVAKRSNSSKVTRASSRKKRKKACWSEKNFTIAHQAVSNKCKLGHKFMSTFKTDRTQSADNVEEHKVCSKHFVPISISKKDPGFIKKVVRILRHPRKRRTEINIKEIKFIKISKRSVSDNDNSCDKEQPAENKPNPAKENAEIVPIKGKDNKEETPFKVTESKNKNNRKVEKLRDWCFNYFKAAKLLSPRMKIANCFRSNNLPEKQRTYNYKRKKKKNTDKVKILSGDRKTNDKEATRKYRISTYLSELDWKRKKCKFHNMLDVADDTLKINPALNNTDKDIKNNDTNKVSLEDKGKKPGRNRRKWFRDSKKRKEVKEEDPVVLLFRSTNESMKNNKGSQRSGLSVTFPVRQSCQRVLDLVALASDSDEYDITRIMDYYRSLGHHDFDDSDMLLRAHEGYLEQIISEQKKKLASAGDRQSLDRSGSTTLLDTSMETLNLNQHKASKKEKKMKQIYTECKSKHSLKRKKTKQAFTETNAIDSKTACVETVPSSYEELLNPIKKAKSLSICSEREKKKPLSFSEQAQKHILEAKPKFLEEKMNIEKHKKSKCHSPSKFRKAITAFKGLFSNISKNERKTGKKIEITKVDAEAIVRPVVQTVSCQYTSSEPKFKMQNTTAHMCHMKEAEQCISHELLQDAEVDAGRDVCTCATQFKIHSKNVGTYFNKCKIHKNIPVRDACTIHYNAFRDIHRDVGTMHRNCCKMMNNCCVQCQLPKLTKSPREVKAYEEDSLDTYETIDTTETTNTMESLSSIRSDDDVKTDTTVYCLKCDSEAGKSKLQRCKANVVTKWNRGTCTDPKEIRDVSTVTSDWWSPLTDRRTQMTRGWTPDSRKVSHINLRPRRKTFREQGMGTDGRVVKFRSNTQIIPSLHTDVLSPSRYLLESQKYYNELFTSRFYSPHLLPINYQPRDGDRITRHQNRPNARRWKNYKTKRLDDSNPPKKVMLPKDLGVEQIWLAEKVNTKKQANVQNKKHRTNCKLINLKKSKNIVDKAFVNVKTGQVKLETRRFASSEGLSLDSRVHGTAST